MTLCSPVASVSYRVHIPLQRVMPGDWKTRQVKACTDPSSRLNAVLNTKIKTNVILGNAQLPS